MTCFSLSRAHGPAIRKNGFFSFFALVGKLTTVFGPLVFGVVSQWAGLRAGSFGQRPTVLWTGLERFALDKIGRVAQLVRALR